VSARFGTLRSFGRDACRLPNPRRQLDFVALRLVLLQARNSYAVVPGRYPRHIRCRLGPRSTRRSRIDELLLDRETFADWFGDERFKPEKPRRRAEGTAPGRVE